MAGEPKINSYDTGGGATSTTRSPLSVGQVYWQNPFKNRSEEVAYALGVPETPGVKEFYNFDEADGYFYSTILTNPNLREQYRQRFVKAGFKIDTNQDLLRAWQTATGWASDSYLKGGRRLTPWDAIDELGAANGEADKTKEVNVTETSGISRNVTISTEQQARGALMTASKELLGRDPSKDEIKLFTKALNSLQRANPKVTAESSQQIDQPVTSDLIETSDGVTKINRNKSTQNNSSVSTGGFDTGQYAFDVARSQDDYAEYQAETTFMNALLSAIQSPVNI
jgi:hypothetical protein